MLKQYDPVLLTRKFFNNKFIFGAFGIGVTFLALVLFIAGISVIFKVESLSSIQIIMIAGTTIITFILIQFLKFIK
ncbi:MAG: cation transporting ATPase C-terminal domain-containing protein [Oscillospiraceae bacterium]|nr:cation transporting ATPase C-terminal domain-containing protein [Oscillospiraceae bacterium]